TDLFHVVWKIYEEFSFNGPFRGDSLAPAWVQRFGEGSHRLQGSHCRDLTAPTIDEYACQCERSALVTSLKRSFFPTTNSQAVEIDCFSFRHGSCSPMNYCERPL